MKPSQLSVVLRRIAVGIDNCEGPVRPDLVSRDLKKILVAMDDDDPWDDEAEQEFEDVRGEGLEDLTLQDVQGGPDYDLSPEEKALMAMDPKFQAFLRDRIDLSPGEPIKYDDVVRVLVEDGLEESAARNYALFAMHEV
jgi:hypothetical protein